MLHGVTLQVPLDRWSDSPGRTSRRCRSGVVVAEAAGMQTSAALSSAIMKDRCDR